MYTRGPSRMWFLTEKGEEAVKRIRAEKRAGRETFLPLRDVKAGDRVIRYIAGNRHLIGVVESLDCELVHIVLRFEDGGYKRGLPGDTVLIER